MIRSHSLQLLLNYFDNHDRRVREGGISVDAQLLDSVAVSLDDLELKLNRELSGMTPKGIALNLDNGGLYWSARFPQGWTPSSTPVITGVLNGATLTLAPYDDTLPVPSRILSDPSRSAFPLASPVLFAFAGTKDPTTKSLQVQHASPGTLPCPNKLTLWLSNLPLDSVLLNVHIEGQRYPQSPWPRQQVSSDELLTITQGGFCESAFAWNTITRITVRGLPQGAVLTGYSLPFQAPGSADLGRPFYESASRGASFPRIWSTDGTRVTEQYFAGNLAGYEYIQSYQNPPYLTDLAVEPATWGLYLAGGTTLYYMDRREPMPGLLAAAGLRREPAYNLLVKPEPVPPSNTSSYVTLEPSPAGNAGQTVAYRYLMTDPAGTPWALTPDGMISQMSSSAGWRNSLAEGAPRAITVPLLQTGTYQFSLQAQLMDGTIVSDTVPYANLAFHPLASLDLSGVVPSLEGIAFDCFGQMWAWSNGYAVPLLPQYDGYIMGADRAYLTCPYTQVLFT